MHIQNLKNPYWVIFTIIYKKKNFFLLCKSKNRDFVSRKLGKEQRKWRKLPLSTLIMAKSKRWVNKIGKTWWEGQYCASDSWNQVYIFAGKKKKIGFSSHNQNPESSNWYRQVFKSKATIFKLGELWEIYFLLFLSPPTRSTVAPVYLFYKYSEVLKTICEVLQAKFSLEYPR